MLLLSLTIIVIILLFILNKNNDSFVSPINNNILKQDKNYNLINKEMAYKMYMLDKGTGIYKDDKRNSKPNNYRLGCRQLDTPYFRYINPNINPDIMKRQQAIKNNNTNFFKMVCPFESTIKKFGIQDAVYKKESDLQNKLLEKKWEKEMSENKQQKKDFLKKTSIKQTKKDMKKIMDNVNKKLIVEFNININNLELSNIKKSNYKKIYNEIIANLLKDNKFKNIAKLSPKERKKYVDKLIELYNQNKILDTPPISSDTFPLSYSNISTNAKWDDWNTYLNMW